MNKTMAWVIVTAIGVLGVYYKVEYTGWLIFFGVLGLL
jgi:hypothetical protein